MSDTRQLVGRRGEDLAVLCLKKMGYTIVERNYRTKLGEIDVIAREAGALAFVEVKTRNSRRFGSPKESITSKKRKKLSMLAAAYMKKTDQTGHKARFDVVAVELDGADGNPVVEVVRNAFYAEY